MNGVKWARGGKYAMDREGNICTVELSFYRVRRAEDSCSKERRWVTVKVKLALREKDCTVLFFSPQGQTRMK